MKTAGLNPGDVVEVDIRGCVFPALFKSRLARDLVAIEPLVPNLGYFRVRARQIRRLLERNDLRRVLPGSLTGGRESAEEGTPPDGSPAATPAAAAPLAAAAAGTLFDPDVGA